MRGDEQLCDWLAKSALASVHVLIAWDAGLTDRGAHAICEARPAALASIDLSWNHVGPEGAAAVARRARPLHGLNLCGNRLGDDGAAALCAPRLAALRELALGWNEIGDGGARALAAGAWPELGFLNIRANQLPPGATAM